MKNLQLRIALLSSVLGALVIALCIPVAVEAKGGAPAGAGNDTNAETECDTGELLEGDGNCIPIPVDTNAATECPIGHALLGGGLCLDMTAKYVEQECSAGVRFVDLGLTVFDCDTNLEWEKKTDDGSIHDKDNTYTWSTGDPWNPDGTAFTVFLATLNTEPCFAGHCDWRLPEMGPPHPHFFGGTKLNGDPADTQELETILDCNFSPCIDPIFGATAAYPPTFFEHWSSITAAGGFSAAWMIVFTDGSVLPATKVSAIHTRAVRSGP